MNIPFLISGRCTPDRRLLRDRSGVALLEFALGLPVFLLLILAGAELTNYVSTRMRISQLTLHIADNAARIGSGSQLQVKKITEADINDVLTGAGTQAAELDLYARGRVIISSLEAMPAPNTTGRYRVRWQRCRGQKRTHKSSYGVVGRSSGTNMEGMGPGPVSRQAIAPEGGATMFVEVYYEYEPLVGATWLPSSVTTRIIDVASMMVRDRRDLSGGEDGVYQVAGVSRSGC